MFFLFNSEVFHLLFLKSIKGLRHDVLTLHLSDEKIIIEGWWLLLNYVTSVVKVKISKRKRSAIWLLRLDPKENVHFGVVTWTKNLIFNFPR